MPEGTSTTALLGPTNTGKTHHAVECMLSHASGMIGLPLRLLAREVYDKVSTRVGEARVALVTGEEKRIPRRPDYWVCTVEAMPVDREVDFIAVDEVQLAAHPQRGHVFTERLLHARGRRETWFLGSESMKPAVEELVPAARFEQHARLSKLAFAGSAKLHKLPSRSAVVAFSTPHVYELAERMKRAYGGVAVVLGALSPRTRNAQVAMFQAGEVDMLVATDAIGMGLNLAVDHVAFSALRKFDGKLVRDLDLSEMAQIAGRAGRYKTDGTFGSVSPLELPVHLAEDIEEHRTRPVTKLQWRSAVLDFASPEGLVASLKAPARGRWLRSADPQEDLQALQWLIARPQVRARATNEAAVKVLWEVCTVPDFRKLLPESHYAVLETMFLQLVERGQLDEAWVDERVREADDVRSDVDGLMSRMGAVRTWTYVSHRPGWLPRAEWWQERTRAVEDRLSDALHNALVARFVEKGAPARTRREKAPPEALVEAKGPAKKALKNAPQGHPFAALRSLRAELEEASRALVELERAADITSWPAHRLASAVADAPHDTLALDSHGVLSYRGVALATLVRGTRLVLPDVKPLDGALTSIGAGARAQALRRLVAFARDAVETVVHSAREASHALTADAIGVPARQALYALEQRLGTVLAGDAPDVAPALTERDVRALREHGVYVDGPCWYLASSVTPESFALRRTLCALWYGAKALPEGLVPEARSVAAPKGVDRGLYTTLGFPVFGPRAVRSDVVRSTWVSLEARRGTPPPASRVASWLGCTADEVGPVWRALANAPAVTVVDPAQEPASDNER